MAVQVQQEQVDHCRVTLKVEVPPEDFQKAMDRVFAQFAKRTNVPGFRPGKAPRHLLKRYIDEERVKEFAVDQALNDAYRDALRQTGVVPYTRAEPQVDLQDEELEPDRGFSFTATVPLQPHVHLGDLSGLSARRVVVQIKDEDVEREINRYRELAAGYEPTEEGAETGDRVRLTMSITMNGEPVPEAGLEEPTLLEVGANLEEFDAGIRGIKPGEERTFDLTYPQDYGDEELAGKTATATVQATEVLRRVIPEADDAFAAKLGFENLEALRARLREGLQGQADAVADQELTDSLIDEVVRRSEVHYPEEMLAHEVSQRLADLIQALERRSITLEEYLHAQETDLAALQESMRADAEQSLRNTLVLMEVAAENKITVSDKDIEEEVKRRAEAENVKPSQMRRVLRDSGELDALRHRLFFRKVVGFLREQAEIREVAA